MKEKIEVPFDTPAGRRCYEVMYEIALRRLHRARGAVTAWAADAVPDAEPIDEKAMTNGKYAMFFRLSSGDSFEGYLRLPH